MNTNTFWGKSRSTGVNVGLIVRIGLATLCLIGSVALTWTLLSPHQGAHASPNTPSPTPTARHCLTCHLAQYMQHGTLLKARLARVSLNS